MTMVHMALTPKPTPVATVDLTCDLVEPLLTWAILNRSTHSTSSRRGGLLYVPRHNKDVHACLSVLRPSAHLTRVALRAIGVPSAESLSRAGDVAGLNMLIKLKYLSATNDGGTVFWTAVEHNQVEVLEWWTRTMAWPVCQQVTIGADNESDDGLEDDNTLPYLPVPNAVDAHSVDAIAWLLDHPDVVGQACTRALPASGASFPAGAITDSSLARLIEAGHEALALRWIHAKYAMVCESRLQQDQDWPDVSDDNGWQSRLMQVVSERGSVHVFDALEASIDLYSGVLLGDASRVVQYAIRHAQLEVLQWWFSESRPWRAGYIDLVASVCDSKHPLAVLDWWKASIDGQPKQVLPMTYDSVGGSNAVLISDWLRRSGWTIAYSEKAIDWASQHGNVALLDWWKSSGLPLKYTEQAMDKAHSADVLDWWLQSGLELKYSTNAMDYPRNLDVLDWWKSQQGRLDLKYTSASLDDASCRIDFDVLNWWTHSGLEMRAKRALLVALQEENEQVIGWWLEVAGNDALLDTLAFEAWGHAFRHGDKKLLDVCQEMGLPVSCKSKIIDECANAESFDWWGTRIDLLPFVYSESALAVVSERGRVDLLEWWDASGLELLYDTTAMDSASANGHSKVLEWWFLSGLDLKYTQDAMDQASANGHIHVLHWWLDSGLDLKYTESAMDNASVKCNIKSLKWWVSSGLPLKYSERAIAPLRSLRYPHVSLRQETALEHTLVWWEEESGLDLSLLE